MEGFRLLVATFVGLGDQIALTGAAFRRTALAELGVDEAGTQQVVPQQAALALMQGSPGLGGEEVPER